MYRTDGYPMTVQRFKKIKMTFLIRECEIKRTRKQENLTRIVFRNRVIIGCIFILYMIELLIYLYGVKISFY